MNLKKIMILFLFIISFICINDVKADTKIICKYKTTMPDGAEHSLYFAPGFFSDDESGGNLPYDEFKQYFASKFSTNYTLRTKTQLNDNDLFSNNELSCTKKTLFYNYISCKNNNSINTLTLYFFSDKSSGDYYLFENPNCSVYPSKNSKYEITYENTISYTFNPKVVTIEKTKCIIDLPVGTIRLIYFVITALQVATPIILIIMGMIDLLKAITSSSEEQMKKAQSKFIKRLIMGVCVFLVIFITKIVVKIIPDDDKTGRGTALSCLNYILNGNIKPEHYDEIGDHYNTLIKAIDEDMNGSSTNLDTSIFLPLEYTKEYKVDKNTYTVDWSRTYEDKLTKSAGRVNGVKFIGQKYHDETYYDEKVLPGAGLVIPGRHLADDGTIRDKDGYIVVAADLSYYDRYDILMTTLGPAKVYDTHDEGIKPGGDDTTKIIDIYVNW